MEFTNRARAGIVTVLALLTPVLAQAQVGEGRIVGTVVTTEGRPAPDAVVRIIELGRRTTAGGDGSFVFESIRPGHYHVEVSSRREGRAVHHLELEADETEELRIVLDPLFQAEEIVVTATPLARGRSELVQAANVLSGQGLSDAARASLGETLANEPGVSSTYFGPAASRPVIRGLGGDRIRILQSGVGVGDASNTSPDHAVSVEPLTAERIEIIRGPATLLYGSSAIGGVVNVIEERIPRELSTAPVSGKAEVRGGTAAGERSGGVSLTGSVERLAWHVDAMWRKTGDYAVPSFFPEEEDHEEHGHEEEGHEEHGHEEAVDVLENSALENRSGGIGLSWIGDRGFVGISFTGYDSEYGIPGHGHHHEEEEEHEEGEEEEESVTIDLEQRRFDLESAWYLDGAFRRLKARLGLARYEHVEIEGDEIGTRFTNDNWEARFEAQHRPLGPLSGAVGVQFGVRDFAAVGEEAFVPPTRTDDWAIFLFEEIESEPVRWEFGARLERQEVEFEEGGDAERDFTGVSVSGGLVWPATDRLGFAVSTGRSVKFPTAEELFSDGPHLATNAFEVGNPDLEQEVAVSLDVSGRLTGERVSGELTGFVNRLDGFIFQAFTGEEEDGLPVLLYTQGDARFLGIEGRLETELLHRAQGHLALEIRGDWVDAELTETGRPLPRIPPLSLGAALRWDGRPWRAKLGVEWNAEQGDVAPLEEPTDGYAMLDALVGYRFFTGTVMHDLTLQGTNLTDELARNHVSLLKEVAPLPGRDIRLTYRIAF